MFTRIIKNMYRLVFLKYKHIHNWNVVKIHIGRKETNFNGREIVKTVIINFSWNIMAWNI